MLCQFTVAPTRPVNNTRPKMFLGFQIKKKINRAEHLGPNLPPCEENNIVIAFEQTHDKNKPSEGMRNKKTHIFGPTSFIYDDIVPIICHVCRITKNTKPYRHGENSTANYLGMSV